MFGVAAPFKNRIDGAQQLAHLPQLQKYKDHKDAIVLGLPRGGVPMAKVLADELGLPLDIVVPRKIGHPNHPEYAVGALTEDGQVYLDPQSMRWSGLSEHDVRVQRVIAEEKKEAQRRLSVYRAKRAPLNLHGKTVILIDDGIATGATMKAAIKSANAKGASKVVVAAPVAAPDTLRELAKMGADVVVLMAPEQFQAVGLWYKEFEQTSDEEVLSVMRETDAKAAEFADRAAAKPEAPAAEAPRQGQTEQPQAQMSSADDQGKGSDNGGEKGGKQKNEKSSEGGLAAAAAAVQAFAAKMMPGLGLGGVAAPAPAPEQPTPTPSDQSQPQAQEPKADKLREIVKGPTCFSCAE